MPQVTTTLQKEIKFYDNDTKEYRGTINLSTEGNRYDRRLFAVVLKKVENEWRPISGTYEDGYTVAKNSSMEAVIAAAKSDDNWFPFQLTNSTDYQVNITELPGDITKYFHFAGDKAEYAVGYYYTTASSKELIEPENTYPIYYPGLADSANNIAKREFSSRIYVPNIKNRIIVQKQDDQNKDYHVAGAKFNLYKVGLDGKEELYDSITTSESMKDSQGVDLIGANSFPSSDQKPLEYGIYYIQEAPLYDQTGYTIVHKEGSDIIKKEVTADSYIVNPERIKVVVDQTGIYAYAGDAEENDGVSVQYGVGAIVRSMLRFAEEDDIDTTLHDITASLMRNNSKEDSDPVKLDYSIKTDDVNINELDLAYNANSALYEYGPVDSDGVTAFTVNSGWARVMIQQCQAHKLDNGSDFQELGDTDLSNLFSRSVIVRVKNQSAGEFKLTNIVDAEGRLEAHKYQSFDFNLKLDATGLGVAFDAALPQTITAKVLDSDGKPKSSIELEKRVETDSVSYIPSSNSKITLLDKDSILVEQLPAGIKFAVNEVENTSFIITNVYSSTVAMEDSKQTDIKETIDTSTISPGEGLELRSGIIQRSNSSVVTYTNKPTEFVFYKVDSTGDRGTKGNPLSGAVFALYVLKTDTENDYENDALEVDASGNLTNVQQSKDWKLVQTKTISTGNIVSLNDTVTSGADGIVSFSGIPYDAKEFRLVELTAPPGYTVPVGQWRFLINYDKEIKDNRTYETKILKSVKNPPAIESITPVDGIQYQIRNYKPQDLPSSGNTGIGWFMKTGAALMISSALFIFFLTQRRKKHESKITSQE